MISSTTLGLDKIVINNCRVKSIDDKHYNGLIRDGMLTLSSKEVYYCTDNDKEFTSLQLTVAEGNYAELKAGVKLIKGLKIDYCILTMSRNDNIYKNLYGYINVAELREQLEQIKTELLLYYGIELDTSGATIKELEIHNTFIVKDCFKEYKRVFQQMMALIPRYKVHKDYKYMTNGIFNYNSFYAYNSRGDKPNNKRYKGIKIYNKSLQLQQKYKDFTVKGNYARLEILLVGSENVKQYFKSSKLSDITDEQIQEIYNSMLDKLILQPLMNYEAEQEQFIIDYINKNRLQKPSEWIKDLINSLSNTEIEKGYPIILDVGQIFKALKKVEMKKDSRYKTKQRFLKHCKDNAKIFIGGDGTRLEEVKSSLKMATMQKSDFIKKIS